MKNIQAKQIYLPVLLIFIIFLYGCTIPGVTAPFNDEADMKVNQSDNGKETGTDTNTNETSDLEETILDYEKRYIPKDKEIYHIGDTVSPTVAVDQKLGQYLKFRINSASVYKEASDADIDLSLFSDRSEIYEMLNPHMPKPVSKEEALKGRFLLCDISIEYDDFYLQKYKDDNITRWRLMYVYDDNSYIYTGTPFYLSNSNNPVHFTNFDIDEGIIHLQAGWIIDKELFNVEEFDVSRLYIALDGDEIFQEFVWLALE